MIRNNTYNLLSILNDSVESKLALDIGGSCLKIAYFHPKGSRYPDKIISYLREHQVPNLTHKVEHGLIHFMSFETEQLDKCIEVIKSSSKDIFPQIYLTGGGAEYYKKHIEKNLNISVPIIVIQISGLALTKVYLSFLSYVPLSKTIFYIGL